MYYLILKNRRIKNENLRRTADTGVQIRISNHVLQDYMLAMSVFETILGTDTSNHRLCAGVGRIALELGDVKQAERSDAFAVSTSYTIIYFFVLVFFFFLFYLFFSSFSPFF